MKRTQIWVDGIYLALCLGLVIYLLPSISVDEDGLISAHFVAINKSYELGKSGRITVVSTK